MSFTISDLIVQTLKNAGVRRVYGIPGDSLNGFTDALYRDGAIAWQHVRHEEAAAFAAAGDAAITSELAVCAASCGPRDAESATRMGWAGQHTRPGRERPPGARVTSVGSTLSSGGVCTTDARDGLRDLGRDNAQQHE